MKLISQISGILLTALLSLVVLYYAAPATYGQLAFSAGLPVNDRIKTAVPGLWLDFQKGKLKYADNKAHKNRIELNKQRQYVREQRRLNNKPIAEASYWLAQAKEQFQADSTATGYTLAGKAYTAVEFGDQVVLLNTQINAYKDSNKKLAETERKLNNLETKLIKGQASLASNKVRLETAILVFNTQKILTDMDIDIDISVDELDLETEFKQSEFLLRTAQELSHDESAVIPAASVDKTINNVLSDAALKILE